MEPDDALPDLVVLVGCGDVPAGGAGWKTKCLFLTRQDLIPRS